MFPSGDDHTIYIDQSDNVTMCPLLLGGGGEGLAEEAVADVAHVQ
jgi:hypothetical protein